MRVGRKWPVSDAFDVKFFVAQPEKLSVDNHAWPGGTCDCHEL